MDPVPHLLQPTRQYLKRYFSNISISLFIYVTQCFRFAKTALFNKLRGNEYTLDKDLKSETCPKNMKI